MHCSLRLACLQAAGPLLVLAAVLAGCGSGDLRSGYLTADPRGFSGGQVQSGAPGAGAAEAADRIERRIQEADLYRVDGALLHLVNAQRGFHVLDLEAPALLGRLALSGLPREMFLAGERALVIASGSLGETRLFEIDVSDPTAPALVATSALGGAYRTSRLVGEQLLVLTESALHDFATEPALAPEGTLALPAAARFAHATPALFFVAGDDPAGTRIDLVDVSQPRGALRGHIVLPGSIADEHKLHFGAGTLRVVTHDALDGALSRLFVVDVTDPDAPFVRSTLEIVRGEQLFATRFTDELAYVVTFEQVDPLWILDLADPDHPTIASALVVPGWSTQLALLPGKLVALGIDPTEGWHTIVSLFDVADPAHPSLASRLDFGWGWSSAFGDHKGLGLFPAEGLVLVPFAGEEHRLAVIDLGASTLALRGWIDVEGEVLRGFPHASRIGALSAQELALADSSSLAPSGRVTIAEDVVDVARLAEGAVVELVSRSSGARAGGLDLPLAPARLFPHAARAAVSGSDASGACAYVLDFSSSPPSASQRIDLGGAAGSIPMPLGWGAPQFGAFQPPSSASPTPEGRVVFQSRPAGAPDLLVGSGELLDGFHVLSIPEAAIETTIGVRGGFVTGLALEGEELSFTFARSVGGDGEGRPLLRHELVRIDLRTRARSDPLNVPGYVVSKAGTLAYTIEERWEADWSFSSSVVALELVPGGLVVRDRLQLPPNVYDFRAAGELLFCTSHGSGVVSSSPVLEGLPFGPSSTIHGVRLGPALALGPTIEHADHFATLLLAEAASVLVCVDGSSVERWELAGSEAVLSWTRELWSWPRNTRRDGASASYLLALGLGGSVQLP